MYIFTNSHLDPFSKVCLHSFQRFFSSISCMVVFNSASEQNVCVISRMVGATAHTAKAFINIVRTAVPNRAIYPFDDFNFWGILDPACIKINPVHWTNLKPPCVIKLKKLINKLWKQWRKIFKDDYKCELVKMDIT